MWFLLCFVFVIVQTNKDFHLCNFQRKQTFLESKMQYDFITNIGSECNMENWKVCGPERLLYNYSSDVFNKEQNIHVK